MICPHAPAGLSFRKIVSLLALSLGIPLLLSAVPARAQVVLSAFTLDQHVGQPSSSTTVTAYLSQPTTQGEWYIQSANITIDGVDHPATVGSTTGTGNGVVTALSYVWDSSSAGNPSEHTISASAQVQWEYEGPPSGPVDTINSTSPAYTAGGSTTAFYGDGRAADYVIAALHLKSLTFNGSVPLRYSASASPAPTPDPALVPTPQLTLDQNGNVTAPLPPMAYAKGTSIPFSIELYPLTGSATVGYTLDLSAKPTATNEAGVALYQTGATPQSFTNPMTLTSKAALYSEVNEYATTLADLRLWVQFTQSTKNWAVVSTYADAGHQVSNTIYALVASPSSPMAKPWVSVLNYACQYAAGTSDPTAATTALTNNLYNHGRYNGGYRAYTDGGKDSHGNTIDVANGYEAFHVQGFLNAALNGQCDDFADFLVCMSSSIGALPLQSQRSASVAEMNAGSSFTTKNITWSPVQSTTAMGTPVTWSYHEWTTNNIYDGCLKFGGTTSPVNMMLPDYFNALVATVSHPGQSIDWDPQGAFTPDPQN